jgi:curved DNA-binding protein CbpA
MTTRKPHEYPISDELNPYEILGVSENDDLRTINAVYRTLITALHPDKSLTQNAIRLGWTNEEKLTAFITVKKAYDTIAKKHKPINVPDFAVNYNVEEEFTIEQMVGGNGKVDNATFNRQFNEYQEKIAKSGYADPYASGYQDLFKPMTEEEIRMIKSGQRPEIKVTTTEQIRRDDAAISNQQLALTVNDVNITNNFTELGLTKINDFSFSTASCKNQFCGTDLKAAYGQNNEYWEDTVRRNTEISSKYNDTTKVDNKMNNFMSERETVTFDPNIERQIQQEEYNRKKMEQLRQLKQKQTDNFYNKISKIHL